MTKKTVFLLWGVMFLLSTTTWSQRILFKFRDGSNASYQISELRKFTFQGDVMKLKKTDNSEVDLNISSIANFRYDVLSSVNEITLNTSKVKIFPNPSRGAVRIQYELLKSEKVAVDIFDMNGRIIRSWPLEQKIAGAYEILWQTNDAGGKAVPSGTYICRITTNKGTVSKMMILE